jgi:hypothetical protein
MKKPAKSTTPRCNAKSKHKGIADNGRGSGSLTCRQPAGWGTSHVGFGRCKFHGGNTSAHKKSVQPEMARAEVALYGLPRDVDPHTALLEELHRTAGHVAWLSLKVQSLETDADLHGPVGGGQWSIPRQEPTIWVRLYQDERKHFLAISAACVNAGIEERRVRLAEQEGQMIAKVISGILEDLGVADQPEVPSIVRRHLTLVEG